jgi:hypothetical protein
MLLVNSGCQLSSPGQNDFASSISFGETCWIAVGACQSPVQPLRTCSTATERRRHAAFEATTKINSGEYECMSLVVSAITPTRQRWCHPCDHTQRAPMTCDRTFRAVGPQQSPCRTISRVPAWDLSMVTSARQGDGVRGLNGCDPLHTPIHGAKLITSREHPLTPKPAFGRVWYL